MSSDEDGSLPNSFDKAGKNLGGAVKTSSMTELSHMKGQYIDKTDIRFVKFLLLFFV